MVTSALIVRSSTALKTRRFPKRISQAADLGRRANAPDIAQRKRASSDNWLTIWRVSGGEFTNCFLQMMFDMVRDQHGLGLIERCDYPPRAQAGSIRVPAPKHGEHLRATIRDLHVASARAGHATARRQFPAANCQVEFSSGRPLGAQRGHPAATAVPPEGSPDQRSLNGPVFGTP